MYTEKKKKLEIILKTLHLLSKTEHITYSITRYA